MVINRIFLLLTLIIPSVDAAPVSAGQPASRFDSPNIDRTAAPISNYNRHLAAASNVASPAESTINTPVPNEPVPADTDATAPILLAAALGSEAIHAPNGNRPQLTQLPDNEDNLRLLEIHVGKYQMEDLLPAYHYRDMVFIPLGYLSELIDLAIKTDPASGIAQGFTFSENRRFYLDSKRGEITIAGKLRQFDRQRVALKEFDDIYVDSYLLGEWLPMKLDIDLYASRLKIIADKPLPFQQRKQREERIAMVRSRLDRKQTDYPLQVDPVGRWSYPLIDQTVRTGILRDASGDFSGRLTYTTYATADLMHMESSWYLTGSDDDIVDDGRVTFAKKSPAADLLGVARATQYAFGHVSEPQIDLVTRPFTLQPGIFISNYPLTRQLQYDSHNFNGDLPPGWEVELYRNNALLDYQGEAVEGQYRFDNVPLLFGNNYFRLVFYGPQGQQREETYTFNLNRSLTPRGKHYYRATISDDEDFGTRTVLEYDAGITNSLSLATSFSSIPIDDNLLISEPEKNHHYLEAGVRGFLQSVFYRADVIDDTQSGTALDWNVQSRLGEVIVSLGQTYFKDEFISEVFPQSSRPLEKRSRLKLDTAIPTSFFPRIPVTLAFEQDQLQGGVTVERISNTVSAQQHGLALSNTLTINRQTNTNDTVAGILQASRRAYGYNFRGNLNYQTSPDSGLMSATFIADGFRLLRYFIASGITHDLHNDSDEIFFNMNRSHGAYSLGVNTRYSTGGVVSVELNFTMGLGREPRTGSWVPSYRAIATQGALSAQVFLDENRNGQKDADEHGLKNVKLRINSGSVPETSNQEGIVYLTGLEPYRELDVELASQTLEDPLWQPDIKGKRVRLRPGHITQINFPVIITGEIDGTAFVNVNGEHQQVRGVAIELIDVNGQVIDSAKTAYDGFYLFSGIPVGQYRLRISPEQIQSLNLEDIKPVAVSISADNPIIYGQDFILQKRPE